MDFWTILDMIVFLAGIYCLFIWVRVNQTKEVSSLGYLLPKDLEERKCLDSQAFLSAILPALLVFGVITTVSGLLSVAQDVGAPIPNLLVFCLELAFFVVLVVFLLSLRKAIGKFWEAPPDPRKR